MKNKFKIALGIFFLLLNLQNLFALGITPGRITITSDKIDNVFNFTILNSEHKNIGISFSCRGDLAENIILNNKEYYFSSNESSKTFSFKLDLNKDFNKSKKQGEIVINELENSKGNIKLGVVTQVVLKLSDSDFENFKDKSFSFDNLLILDILIILILIILFIILLKNLKKK